MHRLQPDGPSFDREATRLLNAAAAGAFEDEWRRLLDELDADQRQWPPSRQFEVHRLVFDVASAAGIDDAVTRDIARELLASVSLAGSAGWEICRLWAGFSDMVRLVERSDDLELLELLGYAPAAEARAVVVGRLAALGARQAHAGSDTRSVERLLHAFGSSNEAYRLEDVRKQTTRQERSVSQRVEPGIPYRVVAIAGGHGQLQRMAAELLARHNVRVVGIPSSREAVRRERDVVAILRGVDAVVLLVRQITHSTSDQVRRVAGKLNVPVLVSPARSAVAIERQLLGTR